ncbi:hypothetical protein JB92DRAFT_3134644 [Gautieria morchelliformis]|nr:hypothetical protein JB92DRAFT_3134644 [Gautieria morchelliformis]
MSWIQTRIFRFPPDLFVKAGWQLANCHVLAGWMENSDGTSFYTPFTPILYQGQRDVNHVFLNKALFDVFNVIICGPSALDREPGVRSGTMTMDVIWELTEVTPGATAAATTFTVNDAFAMLEEDEEVGPIDQHDILSPNHLPTHDNAASPADPLTTSIPSNTYPTRKQQAPI